jgi:DNA polymerase I-like protein with 3'-5' exonuclease and polymerase domains
MLRQIAEVLGISLEDLPATHGYDVVDGNERHLTALGRQRIGRTAVVYPAANTEAPDRCRDDEEHVVVVGEDRKVRYVPRGAPRLLRSLDDCRIVYYDALSGRRAQRRSGRDWSEPFDDLRVAAHLLDENGALDLPSVARRFLDGDRIGRRPSGATPEACRVDELAAEAQLIRDIWDLGRIPERLAAEGLDFVYREIELPVIDPTILMMERGVRVDVSLLERRHREYEAELERLGEKIKAMAGRPVDPGNADDVRRLLYDDLALPVTQRTADGGPSTGQAVLRALADAHLVIRPLLAFRKVDALRRSAGDLLRHVDRATGRVHCTLDPLGTATGRFTCMSPNLQGTPAALKDVLIPADGCALVEADFSQIELRVLAHFSQDPGLLEAFETGGDLHRQTAAALYGISEHAVSGPKRQVGKVVNFSVIYGQTAISLAEELGTSPGQAQQFIDGFFARYPQVRPWIEQVQEEACACGLVRTLYGRRRRFPGLVPGPRADRRTLRQAVNSVIQGTAADILKLAIGRLHAELPAECRMLLTVHDSVLLEAPAGKAADAAQHVQQLMETPPPRFSVRLQAEVATKPC